MSELIYQQLLAKKASVAGMGLCFASASCFRFLQEHSGIDAWYQEYVSEAGPGGRKLLVKASAAISPWTRHGKSGTISRRRTSRGPTSRDALVERTPSR